MPELGRLGNPRQAESRANLGGSSTGRSRSVGSETGIGPVHTTVQVPRKTGMSDANTVHTRYGSFGSEVSVILNDTLAAVFLAAAVSLMVAA